MQKAPKPRERTVMMERRAGVWVAGVLSCETVPLTGWLRCMGTGGTGHDFIEHDGHSWRSLLLTRRRWIHEAVTGHSTGARVSMH